jgi:plasmid stabilization system protein ParE
MTNLFVSEKAYDDLLRILEYIARDKPQAVVQFVDRIQQQCEFLARFPESGTRQDDIAPDLRVFSFRGYGIYFRSLPDRLRIERVLPPGVDVTRQSFE